MTCLRYLDICWKQLLSVNMCITTKATATTEEEQGRHRDARSLPAEPSPLPWCSPLHQLAPSWPVQHIELHQSRRCLPLSGVAGHTQHNHMLAANTESQLFSTQNRFSHQSVLLHFIFLYNIKCKTHDFVKTIITFFSTLIPYLKLNKYKNHWITKTTNNIGRGMQCKLY